MAENTPTTHRAAPNESVPAVPPALAPPPPPSRGVASVTSPNKASALPSLDASYYQPTPGYNLSKTPQFLEGSFLLTGPPPAEAKVPDLNRRLVAAHSKR